MTKRTPVPSPERIDLTGSNSEQAGEHNRTLVLRAFHRHAPISRADLDRHTGLTKPGIARIVDRLLDEGLIMEARRRKDSAASQTDPEGCFSIGVDIDRDHLTILAVDETLTTRAICRAARRF